MSRHPAVSPLGVLCKSGLTVLLRTLSVSASPLRDRTAGTGRTPMVGVQALSKAHLAPGDIRATPFTNPWFSRRRCGFGVLGPRLGGRAVGEDQPHLSNLMHARPADSPSEANLANDEAVRQAALGAGGEGCPVAAAWSCERLDAPSTRAGNWRSVPGGRRRWPQRRRHRMCRPAVPLSAAAQPPTLRNRPRKQGTSARPSTSHQGCRLHPTADNVHYVKLHSDSGEGPSRTSEMTLPPDRGHRGPASGSGLPGAIGGPDLAWTVGWRRLGGSPQP